MPYIAKTAAKARSDDPFNVPVDGKRDIIVLAGCKYPTGASTDDPYLIPLGTPMAPVTAGTGAYKPIRRGDVVTAATAGESILNMGAGGAVGFDVGDVVNVLQKGAAIALMTVATVGTISTINYSTGVITLTKGLGVVVSVGCFVEVAENGAATNPNSAVFLGQNVKTRDTEIGTNVTVQAVGYIKGQVEVLKLADHTYDALTPKQIPNFDFIPATPGI